MGWSEVLRGVLSDPLRGAEGGWGNIAAAVAAAATATATASDWLLAQQLRFLVERQGGYYNRTWVAAVGRSRGRNHTDTQGAHVYSGCNVFL